MKLYGWCIRCAKVRLITVVGFLQPGAALAYGNCRDCERVELADNIRAGLRSHGIDEKDADERAIQEVVLLALPDLDTAGRPVTTHEEDKSK